MNIQTLRYYERRGLLAEPERSNGGHRLYGEEAVTTLRVIKAAQRLGFTLRWHRQDIYAAHPGMYGEGPPPHRLRGRPTCSVWPGAGMCWSSVPGTDATPSILKRAVMRDPRPARGAGNCAPGHWGYLPARRAWGEYPQSARSRQGHPLTGAPRPCDLGRPAPVQLTDSSHRVRPGRCEESISARGLPNGSLT
ncbi:MerR family transcriptional regulator [Streptomyces sp. 8N114]|uniref:MerR family transcriptional regulator n=1 Tax=Streptomyces sp. 8N114 TaxID=3457419 RepID=UPI003FD14532